MQLIPQTETKLKTRLAPTPSGYLHLGNVLSFAITWALVRKRQGILALRIDDLDNVRFRPEYLQDIFDTLDFMGIDYDEGPRNAKDFEQHYSQHLRLPAYRALLDKLVQQNMVYACPCSRSQIAAASPQSLYPFTCREKQLALHTAGAAWRARVPFNTSVTLKDSILGNCTIKLDQVMPDFIVRRKDGILAYQIASLSDDISMGINLIVRGQDLLQSTAAQLFLATQTGAASFAKTQFVHHPVLCTTSGSKLSKSDDALSVSEMRKAGLTQEALWIKLARILGWKDAGITTAQEFLDRFTLQDLPLQLPPAIKRDNVYPHPVHP
ncbi:glutamate--tRNA ligase family protein [uncultured Pontibacter sp.]|uniref:glutamate--tRNA ligase family protein n=1 Tax=uncultured Pontibacter sp. TaxID=453356 RepID=UPI0026171C96|nr:glutamate--tRNA ligase family protein [uncultured Pontibacter sp.]